MGLFKKLKVWLSEWHNLAFLAVLLFALIIRLKYLFVESLWNDETFYLWYAEDSLENPSYLVSKTVFGNTFYFFIIPVALLKLFVGDILLAGRLTALLFNLAGIILVYLVGTELRNKITGLVAAILLSVQSIYWFIGHKILLDAPLATSLLFAAFCLIKWEKKRDTFWAFMLALSVVAVIETKQSGLLIGPILVIYGFLAYMLVPALSKNYASNLKAAFNLFKSKTTYIPLLFFLILMIPYFVGNQVHYHQFIMAPSASYESPTGETSGPIASTFSMIKTAKETGASYSVSLSTLSDFFTFYIKVLLVLGLIFILLYRRKIDLIVLSFTSFFGIYTLLAGGIHEVRYILPAVPFFILISAFGLEEFFYYSKLSLQTTIGWCTKTKFFATRISNRLTSFSKIWNIRYIKVVSTVTWPLAILFIAVLLAYPLYERGDKLFAMKNLGYLGYQEAGAWIRENVPNDAVIFAGSPGYIRLFSGYDFVNGTSDDEEIINGTRIDEGRPNGNIYYGFKPRYYIQNPTPKMFADYIQTLDKEIYMEVDIWEYSNQEWMWPLTQEKFDFLFSLGFNPVYVVEKDIGGKLMPVIFILKK